MNIEQILERQPKEMLNCYDAKELDYYVLCNVLGMSPIEASRLSPSIRLADLTMLLIWGAVQFGTWTVEHSAQAMEEAKALGFDVGMYDQHTWKVYNKDYKGFGRSFNFAFCKFLISYLDSIRKQ